MQAYIVSDIHLGSKYARYREFLDFVRGLPQGATLVLNGDTVSHWYKRKHSWTEQEAVLDILREESERRPIVWIRGNNDRTYTPDNPGKIEIRDDFSIGRRLFVTHGHRFDRLMPRARWALWFLGVLYRVRRFTGAPDMHIAEYVKRIPILYNVLCTHIANNAVGFAAAEGYEAVTCGHTHCAVDLEKDGVRYINTGAWTEAPSHYLKLNDTGLELCEVA